MNRNAWRKRLHDRLHPLVPVRPSMPFGRFTPSKLLGDWRTARHQPRGHRRALFHRRQPGRYRSAR